jgi:uncharacterized protein YegP (UPF0339 family)
MKKTVQRVVVALFLVLGLALAADHFALAKPKKDSSKDKGGVAKGGVIFELYKDRGGKYRFRLKQEDKLLAIAGKGYPTRAECQKVIDAIKRLAAKAKVVEKAVDKGN